MTEAIRFPGDEADAMWVLRRLPVIVGAGWRIAGGPNETGAHYVRYRPGHRDHLSVILSGRRERDGRRWMHLSVARPDRLPTWEEFVYCKERFLGIDARAIQVIPPRGEHINQHPNCLHLFVCADGEPLPDFRDPGGASL